MAWSDAARAAAAASRRAKAKGKTAQSGQKTWANKGFSGTVGQQIQQMTPQQRTQVKAEHPWLFRQAPTGEPGLARSVKPLPDGGKAAYEAARKSGTAKRATPRGKRKR